MSRIKTQILSKLKEYASKMGTNTMGGDDYTSKKKGGLRDNDGYDNVDYNRDMPQDESVNEAKDMTFSDYLRILDKKIEDAQKAVTGKNGSKEEILPSRGDILQNFKLFRNYISVLNKKYKGDKTKLRFISENTNKLAEACWKGYKQVGGKIKNGKQVPNCVPESISEGMFSVIDQIKKDSKDIRDFLKKVFKDREFKKMSNDKEFIKYLKSIYEGIEENFPSNWLQGRVSDYHTSLRGKKKDYSGGTNFKKNNSGQSDIEDEIEESGKDKSEKNYKDWKNTNEGFDKIEHLKLLNKAMRAMPGSPKQKDIIRKLNVVRKAGGMRPLTERTKTDSNSKGYKEATKLIAKLRSTTFKKMNDDELEQFRAALAFSFDLKEYASKLTLSYMLDKDSKLDGTPEDIKAIDEKAKRDYKDEYKKFQSSTKAKKYRAELNKYNRDKGTYGNGDGKDASHKGGMIVGFESESKNRGRAEKSRLKKESVNEGISKDDIKIEKSMTGFYNILVWNKGWQLFSKHRLEGMGKEVMKAMNSRKGMKYVEKLINKQNQKSSSEIIAKKSEKNGIARLIGESVNEVGQFPIHNYIQGIIPTGYLDTHTPQKKKQSVKLVSDLKKTLNNFWKSHDIPYRIK